MVVNFRGPWDQSRYAQDSSDAHVNQKNKKKKKKKGKEQEQLQLVEDLEQPTAWIKFFEQ